jgi:hypothetical protein
VSDLSPEEGARRLRRLSEHLVSMADKLEHYGRLDPSAVNLALAQLAAVKPYASDEPEEQGPSLSGKNRIKRHFAQHVGEVVTGQELAAVSGVLAWSRRVRELREEGMAIEELGGSRYVLHELPMQ